MQESRWPRVLFVLGWICIGLGALGAIGHVIRPDTAGNQELGKYGNVILDVVFLGVGVTTLFAGRRLRRR